MTQSDLDVAALFDRHVWRRSRRFGRTETAGMSYCVVARRKTMIEVSGADTTTAAVPSFRPLTDDDFDL